MTFQDACNWAMKPDKRMKDGTIDRRTLKVVDTDKQRFLCAISSLIKGGESPVEIVIPFAVKTEEGWRYIMADSKKKEDASNGIWKEK